MMVFINQPTILTGRLFCYSLLYDVILCYIILHYTISYHIYSISSNRSNIITNVYTLSEVEFPYSSHFFFSFLNHCHPFRALILALCLIRTEDGGRTALTAPEQRAAPLPVSTVPTTISSRVVVGFVLVFFCLFHLDKTTAVNLHTVWTISRC